MTNFNFNRRTILVTGGTRGIGASIASHFLKAGGEVYCLGRSRSAFESFRENFAPEESLHFIQCDLSIPQDVVTLTKQLEARNFDILVNNAGINKVDTLEDISSEDFEQIQRVNVWAPFKLIQALAPSMRKQQWGRILNIASIFGSITRAKRLSYSTSKSALIGMTRTAAVDLASHGVLVNSLSPGFIDTELTREILSPEEIHTLASSVPLNRLGNVDEISKMALFLCSESNSFLTGQNIVVDGGFSIV